MAKTPIRNLQFFDENFRRLFGVFTFGVFLFGVFLFGVFSKLGVTVSKLCCKTFVRDEKKKKR